MQNRFHHWNQVAALPTEAHWNRASLDFRLQWTVSECFLSCKAWHLLNKTSKHPKKCHLHWMGSSLAPDWHGHFSMLIERTVILAELIYTYFKLESFMLIMKSWHSEDRMQESYSYYYLAYYSITICTQSNVNKVGHINSLWVFCFHYFSAV